MKITEIDKQFLDEQEIGVLISLINAWDKFTCLPQIHGDDLDEFRHAIHQAQNIILARPVMRRQKDFMP